MLRVYCPFRSIHLIATAKNLSGGAHECLCLKELYLQGIVGFLVTAATLLVLQQWRLGPCAAVIVRFVLRVLCLRTSSLLMNVNLSSI